MIHTEAWYREADLGGKELQRLQEEVLRGGPEAQEALLRYHIRIDTLPAGHFTLEDLTSIPLGSQILEEGLFYSELPATWLWPFFWEWVIHDTALSSVEIQALESCPEEYQPHVTYAHSYEILAIGYLGDNGHMLESLDRGSIQPDGNRGSQDNIYTSSALKFIQMLQETLRQGGDEWMSSDPPWGWDTYVAPPKREEYSDAILEVESQWSGYSPVEIKEIREVGVETVSLGNSSYIRSSPGARAIAEWLRGLGNS